MSYRTLPQFNRGIRVSAEGAKQDRIDLEIGNWYFTGDDVELQSGILSLLQETYVSHNGQHEQLYSLFQRPQGRSRFSQTISLAKPRATRMGSPLIAGQLKIKRLDGDDFSPSRYQMVFELKLNPTRALNHQPLHPDIRAGRSATSYPRVGLFRHRSFYRVGDEISLDRNDNLILDRRLQGMSTSEHWPAYRNLYLQEVERFIDQLLVRAFHESGMTGSFHREPRFNLKAAETYWEFSTVDPVRLVYSLQPAFRSLGTQSQFRLYDGVVTDLTTTGHVPSLNFKVVEGVTAKVYAKTTRRVRLETLHDMTRSNRVATSHTCPDLWGIITLLEEIADHDAREVNVVLETLERHAVLSERQLSPYELVRHVVQAAPDEAIQQALLSILINARGIRLEAGDPFRPAINELVRRGVLERSRRSSQSYRVAEHFISACEVMSDDVEN